VTAPLFDCRWAWGVAVTAAAAVPSEPIDVTSRTTNVFLEGPEAFEFGRVAISQTATGARQDDAVITTLRPGAVLSRERSLRQPRSMTGIGPL
jgi:hypothetical protein